MNKEHSKNDIHEPEIITICSPRKGDVRSFYNTQRQGILAVVDTAAEVSHISTELFDYLSNKPSILREVALNTTGKGFSIKRKIVRLVEINLGTTHFTTNLCVA